MIDSVGSSTGLTQRADFVLASHGHGHLSPIICFIPTWHVTDTYLPSSSVYCRACPSGSPKWGVSCSGLGWQRWHTPFCDFVILLRGASHRGGAHRVWRLIFYTTDSKNGLHLVKDESGDGPPSQPSKGTWESSSIWVSHLSLLLPPLCPNKAVLLFSAGLFKQRVLLCLKIKEWNSWTVLGTPGFGLRK